MTLVQQPALSSVAKAPGVSLRLRWKRWVRSSPVVFQLVADTLAVTGTTLIFYLLRLREGSSYPLLHSTEFVGTVVFAAVVYWIGLFWLAGLYQNWFIRSPFDEAYTIIKAAAVGGAIPTVAIVLDSGWFSYKLIVYTILLATVVIAMRYGARRVQRSLRAKGVITLPTLLVGDQQGISEFIEQFDRHAAYGYALRGAVVTEEKELPGGVVPVIGNVANFEHICRRISPAACIFTFHRVDHDQILHLANIATANGAQAMIVPDLYQLVMGTVRTLSLYGLPLIEISPQLLKPWQAVVKRALDIVVSATVLIVGAPFWLLIALAIKLDSPGPVLFTQYRVGLNNRPFKLYKFRSLTCGQWDGTWVQPNDPRVTRVGAFIRRYYLDEIPQFWNVLKGDMSLVGPRPEQVVLVEKFAQMIPYYTRRHIVRPGITGWGQLQYKERALLDMLQEIRLRLRDDFYYIENLSLRLDFEIMIRTLFVVLRGHGTV
ncbi:MAG: sugar transferase [Candidatus Kapabacteria bacterium]|nr:sugar transferase [Candidatus Kapabacteria bacterium]MCX7936095.1 sugar transferase [Chlorobiota bacterium]